MSFLNKQLAIFFYTVYIMQTLIKRKCKRLIRINLFCDYVKFYVTYIILLYYIFLSNGFPESVFAYYSSTYHNYSICSSIANSLISSVNKPQYTHTILIFYYNSVRNHEIFYSSIMIRCIYIVVCGYNATIAKNRFIRISYLLFSQNKKHFIIQTNMYGMELKKTAKKQLQTYIQLYIRLIRAMAVS